METFLLPLSPVSPSVFSEVGRSSSCRSKNLKACHFPSSCVRVRVSRAKSWNILEKSRVRAIEPRSTFHQRNNPKFLANSASGNPLDCEPEAYKPKSISDMVTKAIDAFYRFSRPHTIIGTVKFTFDYIDSIKALSIVSVALLAVEKLSDISPLFFTGVLEAVAAALMMNIYIVGLNQLSDIEIDKICTLQVNKPYLPLASGEYSFKTGVLIVASFSIMSFWLGWVVGSWPLFWALFISFVLGTAYSINLPLLRWKRFAVVAAMCILAVRAVIVQLAFYLHMQFVHLEFLNTNVIGTFQTHVYGRPAVFSRPLIFATAFMSFFSVVIALFKDIPDIEGDKIFGIRSFTVHLGQERVFWTCISLLQMAYGVAILVGATSSFVWSKIITVLGHGILASILWNRAKSVDLKSKTAITSCYMFIWKPVTILLGVGGQFNLLHELLLDKLILHIAFLYILFISSNTNPAVLCRVFADTTCEMSVKSRSRVTCKQRACF
ncbi:hypothetical protein Patl1_14233 [Pistacia atlantica]|uniref:Uncharacterized protein n=1 Tax=Pistacia atlantica TaxID=434234 RepID=A0ACC1ASA4_9ROSI|nr:hypothetical protein Patl1_14233 [Pistacia atlantica]